MNVTITLTGTAPLLQHNVRLADPLDEWTKRLSAATAKRTKTEDDHKEIQRIEWFGGLYNDASGIYVPTAWLLGSLIRGGVVYGRKGTAVKQSVIFTDLNVPLLHDGPASLEKMWENPKYRDTRAVAVGQKKVMRTRPKFPTWAVEANAYLDTNGLDFEVLEEIAERAGALIGIGDYRPTFGRYEANIKQA